MTTNSDTANRLSDLRARAVAHLKGPDTPAPVPADASAALAVLYELASSPSTAPNALALLHELQVQQVEVDLQDEELRASRLELEESLNRQIQLYDYAPLGYLTLDHNTVVRELNQTVATLVGVERDALSGMSLADFLTPEGCSTLRAMLRRLAEGATMAVGDLHLRATPSGEIRCLHASAGPDPAGGGFLIGMMQSTDTQTASVT